MQKGKWGPFGHLVKILLKKLSFETFNQIKFIDRVLDK